MQASVYRLRDRGIKLPRPSSPQSGDVQLAKIDRGDLRYLPARLLDGDLDVLPPLHKAVITRVSSNGMVIHGGRDGFEKAKQHQDPRVVVSADMVGACSMRSAYGHRRAGGDRQWRRPQ